MPDVTGQNCTSNNFHFIVISYAAATIATLTGNFLVIFIVLKNKKLHTTPNYFIVSMSVSDVFIPAALLLVILTSHFCTMGSFSQNVTSTLSAFTVLVLDLSFSVSMQSLCAISVHRFYAVFYPLQARLESLRICASIICCIWMSSIALFAPRLYYSVGFSGKNKMECKSGVSKKPIWDVFSTTLIVVTLTVMLALYSSIIVHLKKQKLPGMTTSSSLQATRRRQRNTRLSVMFITLSTLFFLSWGSFWILILVVRYSSIGNNCILHQVLANAEILPALFTSTNPLIYFIFSSNYRQGLKDIFHSCNFYSVEKGRESQRSQTIE